MRGDGHRVEDPMASLEVVGGKLAGVSPQHNLLRNPGPDDARDQRPGPVPLSLAIRKSVMLA